MSDGGHGHGHDHGHGHSHGGGCGGGGGGGGHHGHSHGPNDASDAENLRGQEFNLYLKIDMDTLTCLNEEEDGSGKTVFRAFEQRLDRDKVRLFFALCLFSLSFCFILIKNVEQDLSAIY